MEYYKAISAVVFLLAFAVASAAAVRRSPVSVLYGHKVAGKKNNKAPVTFVFGDSLTDVGNNNYLAYSLAKCDYPWYGIDFAGGPTGRCSNGRTIGDIISSKLGIAPPPAYMSLSLKDDSILNGVNYASAGAGILNETGLYFVQKLSFDDQISCFEKTKKAIVSQIGEEAADKLANDAIYFIGLGSNDYVNNFMQPFLPDGIQYTHGEFLDLLMSTLTRQFKRLYGLGARKVIFHGIGPLGCIPSQRAKSPDRDCLKHVNNYVRMFNFRTSKLMASLDAQLPGAQFAFTDSYNAVMELIESPNKYGFDISNTSCCDVDTTVGGLCLPNSRLCGDRKQFVFWDGYHPTDAANQVIADRLFADPTATSHPPFPAAPAPSPK